MLLGEDKLTQQKREGELKKRLKDWAFCGDSTNEFMWKEARSTEAYEDLRKIVEDAQKDFPDPNKCQGCPDFSEKVFIWIRKWFGE